MTFSFLLPGLDRDGDLALDDFSTVEVTCKTSDQTLAGELLGLELSVDPPTLLIGVGPKTIEVPLTDIISYRFQAVCEALEDESIMTEVPLGWINRVVTVQMVDTFFTGVLSKQTLLDPEHVHLEPLMNQPKVDALPRKAVVGLSMPKYLEAVSEQASAFVSGDEQLWEYYVQQDERVYSLTASLNSQGNVITSDDYPSFSGSDDESIGRPPSS
eukprot:TRINITY_DN93976_c0_g1_i1.p1 TRINITY_DN93976_c0_g1~~TRINITY_DN93976_c0_g1_i1.p1  ORF type:complete len:214 (+),score=32.85 TRINITY_DN93976_c0_g1_i1:59-700(+)